MGNRMSIVRRSSASDCKRLNRSQRTSSRYSAGSGGTSTSGSRSSSPDRGHSPHWLNGRPPIDTLAGELPDNEFDRLQQQHYLLLLKLGSNYFAPIENPTTALDVGCGTGIWTMEMATAFPNCSFIGVDQITAQPSDVLPANCRFQFCDQLASGLPFNDASFDYVHQRMLVGSVPTGDWTGTCEELFRVTRAGGWVEIVDTDGFIHGYHQYNPSLATHELGPAATQINHWLHIAMKRRGLRPEKALELEPIMQESGFINIHSRRVPIIMGHWGGEAGRMCLSTLVGAVEGLETFLISEKITCATDFHDTLNAFQREANRACYHMEVVIYWGQRP